MLLCAAAVAFVLAFALVADTVGLTICRSTVLKEAANLSARSTTEGHRVYPLVAKAAGGDPEFDGNASDDV